ncbi:MAG: HlyC/CorC family transporter [bacterium]|nr:HlyC/CorC family transporter [bacterium]
MIKLLAFVGLALGVSFLCSLLEAALLSIRPATLNEKKNAGSRGAGLLLDLKQHRIDDAISAILTVNTVANTLGATMAGAQAARVFGDPMVGVFSGVLTLLILVFSEIIPKTLGAIYAVRLSAFIGWTLHFMTRAMTPALFASRAITRWLTRKGQPGVSRGELAAMITTATQDGALSDSESKIFANLLSFHEVSVGDVMTPRTVTFMLPCRTTVRAFTEEADAETFSRVPLYRDQRDNVVGYVLQREVLLAMARRGDRDQPIENFMRPIQFVPETASVGAALRSVLERREPIAMVTDEHGGVEGLITLEDLTETILGVEIVDESDRDVDLRDRALTLREERLERLRQRRQLQTGRAVD